MDKIAVLAIGGNSLIKDKEHESPADEYKTICETAIHIAGMVEQGYGVVITHGNGPQVGFSLRRAELAYHTLGMPFVSLAKCGAHTQGGIGYQIQQALDNEFRKRGIDKKAVAVVTQVIVDSRDPSFANPSKPIGTFYTKEEADTFNREHPRRVYAEDSGRGYRRIVASPMPLDIVEKDAIKELIQKDFVVIGVGGGGIPVIRNEKGELEGVAAVIDKDNASGLLASEIGAYLFVISTAVDRAYINFGKANQKPLDKITVGEAKEYVKQGQFSKGSMLPKIQAIVRFLEAGGKEAIVTCPESIERALQGKAGTHIVP